MAKTQVRGEQILDQSVSLTADIKDTLAIANGGTGATSASAARTNLGAQALISPATAYVATSESTGSTTYTDLTTTTDTVTVTIGASGLAVVILFAYMTPGATNAFAHMGFVVSGANTLAADDSYALGYQSYTASPHHSSSAVFLIPGLTAGSSVFKAKYRSENAGSSFQYRRISVIPL